MHVPAHVPLRQKNAALMQKNVKHETANKCKVNAFTIYSQKNAFCSGSFAFRTSAIHTHRGDLDRKSTGKQSVYVELRKNALN